MNRAKPPWPYDTVSPWAGKPNPPSVPEVARMYPGRAVGNALLALMIALLLGPAIAGLLGLICKAVFGEGVAVGVAIVLNVILIPTIAARVWWGFLDSEIRGWSTSGWGDGD
jgi:ABC-type uncharacterized transport system permease subunit